MFEEGVEGTIRFPPTESIFNAKDTGVNKNLPETPQIVLPALFHPLPLHKLQSNTLLTTNCLTD